MAVRILADPTPPITTLDQADRQAGLALGRKARELSRLLHAGYPVPPGFVATPAAFLVFAAANDVTGDSPSQVTAIGAGQMPPSLMTAFATAYAQLGAGSPPVAVRSSCALEDLADSSFAGQYDTVLGVVGVDGVAAAIKTCWASAVAPHVQSYAEHHGFAATVDQMSVLVQRLVVAEAAGVAFGVDPVTGDASRLVINASWGLGESVVAGTVIPDTHTVDWRTRQVATDLGDKHEKLVFDGDTVVARPTTPHERAVPALSAPAVQQVADLVARLQADYGHPLDVEFAWADDHLYLLQVRPITALAASVGP
ncbi:MAG: PEP/pyruvate-binding domain-containing protein [Thermaerobacter sp.]|nr:PEP/pyruvate-binding domain-containing protein [Thermaerobacter sp.]